MKKGAKYCVAYWADLDESYSEDAVDYDIPAAALAADLICEDLTMS